jgi:protein TonB
MFDNLIESDLHKGEVLRKSTFFLGTLVIYALLVASAGVVSVLAYDAYIQDQSLESLSIVMIEPSEPEPPRDTPRPTNQPPVTPDNNGGRSNPAQAPMTTQLSNTSSDLTRIAGAAAVSTNNQPPNPANARLGSFNAPGNPFGNSGGGDGETASRGNNRGGNNGNGEGDAPPKMPDKPPRKDVVKSLGVINGQATHLPPPPYPPIARAGKISGMVNVRVLLDESGKVISAQATSGPPLLREAAVRAAYQARFSPTKLSNEPVKATGIITYNFVLN